MASFSKDNSLKVLNILMHEKNFISTSRLVERVGCERKSIYTSIDKLEINGFGIDIQKGKKGENEYKFNGLYGF